MTKLNESIRLDESHREIIEKWGTAFGITKSDYIRSVIERDNIEKTRIGKKRTLEEWKHIRASVLANHVLVNLLEFLKRESEIANSIEPKILTVELFCKKYGLDLAPTKSNLKMLVEYGLFLIGSVSDNFAYQWTKMGVLLFPELAQAVSNNNSLIEGSVSEFLAQILGDYDDLVAYVSGKLILNKEASDKLLQIVLTEHVLFLNFIRDFSFPISGIIDPDNLEYFRKQMLEFLLYYFNIIVYSAVNLEEEILDTYNKFLVSITNCLRNELYLPRNQKYQRDQT